MHIEQQVKRLYKYMLSVYLINIPTITYSGRVSNFMSYYMFQVSNFLNFEKLESSILKRFENVECFLSKMKDFVS